jgi:dihydroneopterin aldolase
MVMWEFMHRKKNKARTSSSMQFSPVHFWLEQTIDYGHAYTLVREIVDSARFDLIERLAEEIACRLLDEFKMAEIIEITVNKPHAPISGRFTSMGVCITRKRR